MEFKVKNGYVLVRKDDVLQAESGSKLFAGVIAVAAAEDIGVKIFFPNYTEFNDEFVVVRIEDVLVFVGKDVSVEDSAKTDEPKND